MRTIILLQLQRLRREPGLILSMFAMTFGFVFLIGGFGGGERIDVPIYFDASVNVEKQALLLDELNESDSFSFTETEPSTAKKQVALGDIPYAVKAMDSNYQMLIATDNLNQMLVDNYVHQIYANELRIQEVEAGVNDPDFRDKVDRYLANGPIALTSVTSEGGSGGFDLQKQSLFGMTLFFSIYTIIFSLGKLAEEKRTGTWNRVILSPVSKWQVYLGHLSYAFMIGFLQILVVFIFFNYVFNYDIGSNFPAVIVTVACFTFSIVALGMLMLGLVKSLEQLNALVPIVSVSMAMLGGAYWPMEAVSNQVILAISKLLPITYGMEALKDIAIYDQGILSLAEPLSIMILFGVLCMGIGINLIERKV
ncbi:ABC transporter permease [Aquibacillus saliphilus]|uniref:ABC transporter permease n=1 Tax=Aquibacillus saliphilus TaxID=1909422 RepID=UPI001CF0622A|nr:ABC transporter permease [Aquibacillus saliphilus]